MRYLVIGGTGTVGSLVVQELLARNHEVRVMTRSADKAKNLTRGVDPIVGNLLEPKTVRSIFYNIDGAFMLNQVTPTESSEGLMAVTAAMVADLPRLVYMSVHHSERAPWLPHFGSKLGIEAAIEKSGIPYTILRPNNFYQNDFWFREGIFHHNLYTQPLGFIGSARIDVRDIAEAAAIALTENGHEGRIYNLVGPEDITGERCAELWSQALGRTIRYAGDDLETWERNALAFMPDFMVFDYREMYHYFQTKGFRGSPEELQETTRLLGHPPRRYEDYVLETAKLWQTAGAKLG